MEHLVAHGVVHHWEEDRLDPIRLVGRRGPRCNLTLWGWPWHGTALFPDMPLDGSPAWWQRPGLPNDEEAVVGSARVGG